MHTLNSDPNVAKLQEYTIGLFREIEAMSGQSCGNRPTGGVYLAAAGRAWTGGATSMGPAATSA